MKIKKDKDRRRFRINPKLEPEDYLMAMIERDKLYTTDVYGQGWDKLPINVKRYFIPIDYDLNDSITGENEIS